MAEKEKDLHRELANFSTYLKKKGLKITNQRLLVAEKIFDLDSHFTVDTLAEILKDRRDEISRATIYRIISLMVEAGQLIEHNFGQSMKFYEHDWNHEHHDHIVCLDCGRIEEFVNPDIEKYQLEIATKHGYALENHSLNLYGKCEEFKKAGQCSRKVEEEQNRAALHLPPPHLH